MSTRIRLAINILCDPLVERIAIEMENRSNLLFMIGKMSGRKLDRFILETAAIDGPLYVQAQYMSGGARTLTQAEDSFNTWYGQISYALTGEARKYHFNDGTIGKLIPSRASGAVEINARYQQAEREKVAGAKLTSTDFGVDLLC